MVYEEVKLPYLVSSSLRRSRGDEAKSREPRVLLFAGRMVREQPWSPAML